MTLDGPTDSRVRNDHSNLHDRQSVNRHHLLIRAVHRNVVSYNRLASTATCATARENQAAKQAEQQFGL